LLAGLISTLEYECKVAPDAGKKAKQGASISAIKVLAISTRAGRKRLRQLQAFEVA
jgi:hypothetical protein